MALVDRRDGRNFGYGRQLSYAGPQALKDLFGGGHYGTVKRTVIVGRHSCAGVGRRTAQDLMTLGRLIGKPCWITQSICVAWLSAAISPLLLHKIDCPASIEPWLRYAVINM